MLMLQINYKWFDEMINHFDRRKISWRFYYVKHGIEQAISRGLAYAPYSDLIWCETATPNLEEAKKFADAIHEKFPGKLLAYNCSPSFNWKKHLSDAEISTFQQKISEMGYKFQFITLAGFHTQNIAIFELAEKYKTEGMTAYSKIQELEFAREKGWVTQSVKTPKEKLEHPTLMRFQNTISSGKKLYNSHGRLYRIWTILISLYLKFKYVLIFEWS